jgi:hypothetical protein
MKVFISWSGDLSELIASKIRDWLPQVLQSVKPYFTPKDIDKGARWSVDIVSELKDSKVGIICLTSDNLESSWIMFEAGAISIAFAESKICPILFGLKKKDLRGPLNQFQAINFEKEEFKALIETINGELGPEALPESTLSRVFEKWWPDLQTDILETLSEYKPKRPKEKTPDERHDELVGLLRIIHDIRITDLSVALNEDIFVNMCANIDSALRDTENRLEMLESFQMLARNIEFVYRRVHPGAKYVERVHGLIDRINSEIEKKRHPLMPAKKFDNLDSDIQF